MWKLLAQKGELRFHKIDHFRQTAEFMAETEALMNFFGYTEDSFSGATIIDLGCGSKLRSKYFRSAKIVAIEPLANDFMSQIDWCDIKDAVKLFRLPAEEFIPELEDTANFVMCINVLDHVFDPELVLGNVYRYLRSDGEFLLSVDVHGGLDPMHPVKLDRPYLHKMFETGWEVIREYDGLFGHRLNYGKGRALSFILKKRAQLSGQDFQR